MYFRKEIRSWTCSWIQTTKISESCGVFLKNKGILSHLIYVTCWIYPSRIHQDSNMFFHVVIWDMRYKTKVVVSNIFLFSSRTLGTWSNLTSSYFSIGLVQPPTRWDIKKAQRPQLWLSGSSWRCNLGWSGVFFWGGVKGGGLGSAVGANFLDIFGWQILACWVKPPLRGGFKYFYFHPYLGKIPNLTNIFQSGLKPPTRPCFFLDVFFQQLPCMEVKHPIQGCN